MSSRKNRDNALILLSSVFFIWGLITVVSNSLIPHYKNLFQLDYKTVMLFPLAFFFPRILISLPTSFVMEKIGYKKTLEYCLYWCFLGCLAMAYFVQTGMIELILFGIFILASSVCSIQVVSSPYVSLLSTPDQSVRRQSIATASNSIGTVLGPIVLTLIILMAAASGIEDTGQQISIIFLGIALVFLTQIAYFRAIHLPEIEPVIRTGFWSSFLSLFRQARFMRLVLVLLLYVGVEVCFGTFTINYLAGNEFGGLGLVQATQLIAGYWALMFLGRVLFAKFGHKVNSDHLFITMCTLAILVSIIATQLTGVGIGYLLIMVGLFNSTLYPIVYAKALEAAGERRSQGAALLIMCSIGGAALPFIQASFIDEVGLRNSYWVPAISYLLMIWLFVESLKVKS